MNRIDHRQVPKWQQESKKLLPLRMENTFAHAEPLIPSRDGYVLTADDRLAFRFMLPSVAWELGKQGITPEEAYALMGRLENLPAIESVALEMQRDFVVVRKALQAMYDEVSKGQMPSPKQIVTAAQALRDTEL